MSHLEHVETKLAAIDRGEYKCAACQDWTTNVTDGRHHPCPRCRPGDYLRWREAQIPAVGDLVVARPGGVRCRVVLGPEPCEDAELCPVVLVQPVDGGGDVWWASWADVEVLVDAGGGSATCVEAAQPAAGLPGGSR